MWRASQKLSARVCTLPHGTNGAVARARLCTQVKQEPATQGGQPAAKPPAAQQQAATPPPPPPPPPSSSGGGGRWFLRLLGLTVVGAGGVVGYAWYDPKFRSQVETNVPYSKEAFDYIFQQIPFPAKKSDKATKDVSKGEERGLAKVIKPKVEESMKDAKVVKSTKQKVADAKEEARRAVEEKKQQEKDLVKRRLLEKEAESAAENAAIETILTSIVDEASDVVEAAVEAQKAAAQHTRTHTKQLKKAMDDADLVKKEVEWSSLTGVYDLKKKADQKADKKTLSAREHILKLNAAINEGKGNKITKQNKAIIQAQEVFNQMTYDLDSAQAEHEKARTEANLMKEYSDLVKKGKEQFKKELESIKPDVKIGKRVGGRMTEDELNSLIAHAHRRIEQLQRQLAEQQALEKQRQNAALELQKEEDEKLADSRVAREQDKLKAQFEVTKQRMDAESSVEFEGELRQQLTRQAAAHSDHLAEVLKVQEHELHSRYDAMLHDRTVDERDRLRAEIASWIARLKGIEAAIEGRAELEKQGRKAQELWLACQTLQAVIEQGHEEANRYNDVLKPLADELKAIREAGNNHPYVNAILNSIPDEASDRGVWTQDALIERFRKVRRVCKRVAMIDETGATLFKYFLSFFQSMLVFSASKPITEEQEIKPEELSTFVILDNAAHHLDKGDFEQAVKFLNQLTGESRRIALDWIKEARLLLETRQAADALFAHAAASGLGSLFEVK